MASADSPPSSDPTPSSMSSRRRLTAVVLSFGRPELAARAVRSLQRSERPADEIVVVDNDPAESFRSELSGLAPPPTYLPSGENFGFAGGMNRGLRHALERGAGLVLTVNSDAELDTGTLGRLERALEEHPAAGVAGPLLVARADPGYVGSAGFHFSRRTGRARQIGFGLRRDELSIPRWSEPTAVSGCVMLVTRALLDRVGLFDEDLFFSFEDLELCLRARRAGFTVGLARDAVVRHEGGASLSEMSTARLYFATRNHLVAAERGAPIRNPLARRARTAAILALNLAHAVLTPAGSPIARFRAVAAGWSDARGGRLGARGWAPVAPPP